MPATAPPAIDQGPNPTTVPSAAVSAIQADGVVGAHETHAPAEKAAVYGQAFWLTYLANATMMVAVSLLFRYADFVSFLGGSELELGFIMGAGMVGSLLVRVVQGTGIDQYGVRLVWVGSLAMVIGSLLAHLAIDSVHGPAVYVLQILFRTGVAGAVGASITFVSHRAPLERMAEAVGTLGTSGFIALQIGPWLADLICGSLVLVREPLDRVFVVAAVLTAASLVAAVLATRGVPLPMRNRRRPPIVWIMRRYYPGAIVWTGVAMGIGISLPNVFLRTFVKELGFPGIGLFFSIYAMSAFLTRIATRKLSAQIGIRRTILTGLSTQTSGVLLFLVVAQPWHLVAPALLVGVSHALLFPAIVAGGSTAFPNRYRGLGTSLMLAAIDTGGLLGSPLIGGLLEGSGHLGLSPYPTMFVCVATIIGSAGAYYAIAGEPARRNKIAAAVAEVELARG